MRAAASVSAISAALVIGVVADATPPAAAATGRTVTVGPGVDLTAALQDLRPGDTLLLSPGRYYAGLVRPVLTRGTVDAPINVRAADPSRRPLIKGELKLWGPDHWHLDGLIVQGTVSGGEALYIAGGRGWSVRNSEFFGARQTNSYANVAIASDAVTGTGAPTDFFFGYNCVHDAANSSSHPVGRDHNIYVTYAGRSGSGGWITRNIIFGHPRGAGIKIGNGGALGAPGPWGAKVTYNTIANGGRQILMHADVRYNSVAANILYGSTQRFTASSDTTAVYLNSVVGPGNSFARNYAANASRFSWGKTATIATSNGVRTSPRFDATMSCSGYHPSYAKATAYGRYGTGPIPTW